eukprot:scpid18100/ scgid11684/ 
MQTNNQRPPVHVSLVQTHHSAVPTMQRGYRDTYTTRDKLRLQTKAMEHNANITNTTRGNYYVTESYCQQDTHIHTAQEKLNTPFAIHSANGWARQIERW